MRTCLAALALLVPALPAQRARIVFEKWDGTTEVASRAGLGPASGFASQAFPAGIVAGLETVTQTRYAIGDKDASTADFWDVGFVGLDAKGDPDYAHPKPYATRLKLPGQPRGPVVVTHTSLASTPFKLAATTEQWHHYWRFGKAAWPKDGSYLLASETGPFRNTLRCAAGMHREIPRIEGGKQIDEGLGWSQFDGSPIPCPLPYAWRLSLWFAEVVLNGASDNPTYNDAPCPNPNFGYASLDPDLADTGRGQPPRLDDFLWRIGAGAGRTGVALLFWSQTVLPGGGIPTPWGRLHVDLRDPLAAAGPLPMGPVGKDGRAGYALRLGPATDPRRRIAAALPSWSAQAVLLGPGGPRLSSLYTMRPRLLPPGFRAATATAAGKVVATQGARTFLARNDGRGTLALQPKRKGAGIGPAAVVAERTAVRIVLAAGVDSVEVRSNKTAPTHFVWALDR